MSTKIDRKQGLLAVWTVFLIVVGTLGVQTVAAQDEGEAYIPPMGEMGAQPVGLQELDAETQEKLLKRVTLNFKDEELQNVVRLIAADTGLNVVLSDKEVSGRITLSLQDVPVGTALNSILQTHNLTLVRERGGIVRVLPLKKIRRQEIELKKISIPVNWVPAAKVAKALEPFLSEDGEINAYDDTNTVIISDTPMQIDELKEIITQLDVPEKQVLIEARLCEMFVGAQRATGIRWDLLTQDDDNQPLFFQTVDGLGNVVDSAVNVGNTLAPALGYQGGSRVTDVFDTLTLETVEDVPLKVDSFEVGTPGSARPAAVWSYSKDVSIFDQDFNLSVMVDLLEARDLAKTLANPKVVTLNNVPAKINIIRRIPYIDTTIGSGGAQTITFRYEDVGIELTVTPNITNNGYVRMNIQPKQMILISQEGTNRPTVDLRESNTNVIIKDEDTAVILGLRQQNFTESTNAVPWIHRVPLIGWVFKGKSHNDLKNDLVAFVTPRIVKQPGITEAEQVRYDEIDDKWDLPDYFFDDVKWDDSENK